MNDKGIVSPLNYFVAFQGAILWCEQYEDARALALAFDGRIYNVWGFRKEIYHG